jgi:hypothetical protein
VVVALKLNIVPVEEPVNVLVAEPSNKFRLKSDEVATPPLSFTTCLIIVRVEVATGIEAVLTLKIEPGCQVLPTRDQATK